MAVEAVVLWNEPNNKSHWDIEADRDWIAFAEMIKLASAGIRAECPHVPIVLGGISPIDPNFLLNMEAKGVLDAVDIVAVHGFPLDWNHWQLDDWPARLAEVRAVTTKPLWVSEVGASTFGAEEVQEFGLHGGLGDGEAPRQHRLHRLGAVDEGLDVFGSFRRVDRRFERGQVPLGLVDRT